MIGIIAQQIAIRSNHKAPKALVNYSDTVAIRALPTDEKRRKAIDE